MKKRIISMFCIMLVVMGINVTPVLAARPGFTFNVYAEESTSKWTDNYYGNVNAKTIEGDDWTLILDQIVFSKPINSLGMAFAMFRGNTQQSSTIWRTSTGRGQYWWDAPTGYSYNLKGRLDTDQAGYCVSNGVYNADVIW